MKAKLIKKNEHYFLETQPYTLSNLQRHTIIANTFDKPKGHILQLSLKNCQEIERGYGLNEIKEIDLSWQDKPILNIEHITKSPNQRMWDVNVETEGPEVDDEGIYCGWNIKKDEDGCLILKMYEDT